MRAVGVAKGREHNHRVTLRKASGNWLQLLYPILDPQQHTTHTFCSK